LGLQFLILQLKLEAIQGWGCVKRFFTALRAKLKFETDVFFMILRSKIMKNTSVSKENSAAAGGKNLFTQPRYSRALQLKLEAIQGSCS
jgi:hypothetical protein